MGLRVQMLRMARDKNFVFPNYLQHPVLFGLRGECQTGQSQCLETQACSSSSLSPICAGHEVEEVGRLVHIYCGSATLGSNKGYS